MKNRQRGLVSVELALAGGVLFVLLFAVIEFGRLLFVWNTLTEATRRGARLAAVCPVNHPSISRVAVFNSHGTTGNSPVLAHLSPDLVRVEYLNANGSILSSPGSQYGSIASVRVSIPNYPYTPVVPLPGLASLRPPAAVTVLPAESLGAAPNPDLPQAGTRQCFGS